jgi:competence protein ComEC
MPESTLSLQRQPFLFLSLALCAGILSDRLAHLPVSVPLILTFLAIVVALKSAPGANATAQTMSLLVCVVSLGCALSAVSRVSSGPSQLRDLYDQRLITPDEPIELTGVLNLPPEPAPGAYFLDLGVQSLQVSGETRPVTGRVRLTILIEDVQAAREFGSIHLDYGSRIEVSTTLERARSYLNPGSPDFNEFLERRGYDLRGTIKNPQVIHWLGQADINGTLGFLYRLRLKMIGLLDYTFAPQVAGTLKAMIAGNRYFLDPQIEERLREGATFHVLVISGLHIGFIALLILMLTGGGHGTRVRGNRWASALRFVVALAGLWGYAAMVGFAAPVTRAATMLSIGLVAPFFFRQAISLNTFSIAAFAMLALNPALIADPGFQLSFAAVAGMVGIAMPVSRELRRIGEWRPTPSTPYPPVCPRPIRLFAEALFWDERKLFDQNARSPIRYKPFKARLASVLVRYRLQGVLRVSTLLIVTSTSIQLATLPFNAFYFNRVSPVGIVLNVFAGLLTFGLMAGALMVIVLEAGALYLGWSFAGGLSHLLAWPVTKVHSLLVNSIVPFINLPIATFRVAHYDGVSELMYGLYSLTLATLALSLARWTSVVIRQPVELANENSGITQRPRALANRQPGRQFSITSNLGNPSPPEFAIRSLALIIATVLVVVPPLSGNSGRLVVHFLDVGQGDSALVVFPGGATMLVDGGGEPAFTTHGLYDTTIGQFEAPIDRDDGWVDPRDSRFRVGEAVVSRFLWTQHRRRLDYILATHADADHIAGLCDVAHNFCIGEALVGHVPTDNSEFIRFRRETQVQSIPVGVLEAGQQFEIQGVLVQVLWPPRARGSPVTSGNNDSVVVRLVYGSIAVLLAGDIEQPAEDQLVRSGLDLRSDVLKVPHHGSKTSSSEAFLDAVRPRCGIISVGERSRFGHPHSVVVSRYQHRNVRLFQTGLDGTVTMETDGGSINVTTFAH